MSSEITQLPSSIIAIFGGLIGSIFTIAIGKALDLIQKRQEHRYSLQKAFFEKKLRVAELIVGNLQKTINLFEPISTILRKIPDFAAIGTFGNFLESQMQAFSSQAQKILQETDDCFYAAPLYFDMAKLNRVGSLCYEKMLNWMLMVNLLNEKINAIKSEAVDEADREKMKSQFVELLNDITSTLDSLKTVSDKFIKELRNEMKRYEP